MAIRIEYSGGAPVAVCDTTAEALELLKAASQQQEPAKAKSAGSKSDTQHAIIAILRDLKPTVRPLVEGLFKLGTETLAQDLETATGIKKEAFGGLFGAVSKAAKKAHVDIGQIYKTDVRFNGPTRERWYAPGKTLLAVGAEVFGPK